MDNRSAQPRGMQQLYAFGKKLKNDLSLSENPLGCSKRVLTRLQTIDPAINDYPTPNAFKLKNKLAMTFGCKETNVFVANGSESIITSIPRVFAVPGNDVLIPALTFPMFAVASELANLRVRTISMDDQLGIDLAQIERMITKNVSIVFLCNPNNPTGSVISKEKLISCIKRLPSSVLIVVDEVNIEFGGESIADTALAMPNVLLLRSFSKGFGLASLRVGFALGASCLIKKLEEETPPFPISAISEELCMTGIDDDEFIKKTKAFMKLQRETMREELTKIGCVVFPSQANNVFVRLPDSIEVDRFWTAMDRAQISLVKGSCFQGFDDRFFRVSPRLENLNILFIDAISQVLEKKL